MPRRIPTAKVFRVDLDEPLRPLEVEGTHEQVLLVVVARGRLIGQLSLPALSVVPVDVQRAAIVGRLGEELWRAELERLFRDAVGVSSHGYVQPSISVVVCTRDRPDDLARCLEALLQLDPAPLEIVVVDSAPTSAATLHVCDGLPVRYVLEPVVGAARARNRGVLETSGDVIAFTDDDCVVDARWLAGLGAHLADPRVAAVTGVVAPLELDTPAQWLFEAHGGLSRGFAPVTLDGAEVDAITSVGRIGVSANVAVRRSAFERVGLFAEWLGPGTPARAAEDYDLFCRLLDVGDRLVLDPCQLVWHRHRRDLRSLRRTLFDYGHSSSAFATQRIAFDRDLGAARVYRWWWLVHLPRELGRIAARRQSRLPLRLVLAELAGTLAGPVGLWRSRRSRRGIPALGLPTAARLTPPPRVLASATATVSVVIPTRDRAGSLERLLRELTRQTYPVERLEVVVVLDGTHDDSAALTQALDLPYRIVTRETRHAGVAAARNVGVREASGELVVFLDDDVVPRPDCLERHAHHHARANADAGVALGYAPPVVDGTWWSLALRAWWEDHFRRKAEPGRPLRWSDVVTLNSSLPRSLLLAFDGFDETFASRHEDWELGVRLVSAGVPLAYVADAVVAHELDCTFEGAVARQRQEARADVLLTRRHPVVGRELPLVSVLTGGPEPPRPSGDVATAARLERQGRRGAWRRLTRALLREAYLAGVRDEVPTDAAMRKLAAIVTAVAPDTLEVELDGGEPPVVPPIGAVELGLAVGGRVVAHVAPARPGFPWDWDTALERVEREASNELRTAIVRHRLGTHAAPAPEIGVTRAS